MSPRRVIIQDRSLVHLYFRCHNQSFYLKDHVVKKHILRLWAKYKKRYNVRIFDFNIMDNHAHLVARVENPESLGDFMRTVNSQIASFVNKRLEKDSQVLKDRYKSKLVSTVSYLGKLIDYVWTNRYKVDKQAKPETDIFCSASWRLNPYVAESFASNEKEIEMFKELLDPYEAVGINTNGNTIKFVRDRLNAIMSAYKNLHKLHEFISACRHTIGDVKSIAQRSEIIKAYRRNLDLSRVKPA